MALKCKRRPFPIALCGIARIGGCGARNNRFAIFRSWQRSTKTPVGLTARSQPQERTANTASTGCRAPLPALTERSGFTAY